jgi:hypothetical protein
MSIKCSHSSDKSVRNQENNQFELEFRADYVKFKRRVHPYKNSQGLCYYLGELHKREIEFRVEFSSKIESNAIELLEELMSKPNNIKNIFIT